MSSTPLLAAEAKDPEAQAMPEEEKDELGENWAMVEEVWDDKTPREEVLAMARRNNERCCRNTPRLRGFGLKILARVNLAAGASTVSYTGFLLMTRFEGWNYEIGTKWLLFAILSALAWLAVLAQWLSCNWNPILRLAMRGKDTPLPLRMLLDLNVYVLYGMAAYTLGLLWCIVAQLVDEPDLHLAALGKQWLFIAGALMYELAALVMTSAMFCC